MFLGLDEKTIWLLAILSMWATLQCGTSEVLLTQVIVVPPAWMKQDQGAIAYESHSKLIFYVKHDHRTVLDPAHGTSVSCKSSDILCNNRLLTTMIMQDYIFRVEEAAAHNIIRTKRQLGILAGGALIGAIAGGFVYQTVESMVSPPCMEIKQQRNDSSVRFGTQCNRTTGIYFLLKLT